jgi:hypothetical protein
MEKRAFVNSDGDFLIIAQQGALDIQTEFGNLYVQPGEICVIQRGQRFRVSVEGPTRGYILEVWGANFELPELGPLGSNGLANARDFLYPKASYNVTRDDPWEIVYKLGGRFFKSTQNHCPFDVVAWHGNYVPYKYDLTKFVNVGSISVDHIDPSIFCVLTARGRDENAPLADFLIFSPRWDVASFSFRPPYYHRNAASELMGLIYGEYAGRSDDFQPGGISFECGWVPHGVSKEVRSPRLMICSVLTLCRNSRQLRCSLHPRCRSPKARWLSCLRVAGNSPLLIGHGTVTRSMSMSPRCGMVWWIIFHRIKMRLIRSWGRNDYRTSFPYRDGHTVFPRRYHGPRS